MAKQHRKETLAVEVFQEKLGGAEVLNLPRFLEVAECLSSTHFFMRKKLQQK